MAVIDLVRLPEDIERGASGGPEFLTTITTLASGREVRNIEWENSRSSFDIGYGLRNREEAQEVIDFFYARQGRGRAFLFKDWSDFEMERAVVKELPEGRRIVKSYTSGAVTYERIIYTPVVSACSVFSNSADTTPTPMQASTIDLTTGETTLSVNSEVTGEFDIPARFGVDRLNLTVQYFQNIAAPQIPIVEVRL